MEVDSMSFLLQWKNHLQYLQLVFECLFNDRIHADVTIACADGQLKAHKLILSACSPYFEMILLNNPCKHSTVIMSDVTLFEMLSLCRYIYLGSVVVHESNLSSLLKVAKNLQIRGLADKVLSSDQSEYEQFNYYAPIETACTDRDNEIKMIVRVPQKDVDDVVDDNKLQPRNENYCSRKTSNVKIVKLSSEDEKYVGDFVEDERQNDMNDANEASCSSNPCNVKIGRLPSEDEKYVADVVEDERQLPNEASCSSNTCNVKTTDSGSTEATGDSVQQTDDSVQQTDVHVPGLLESLLSGVPLQYAGLLYPKKDLDENCGGGGGGEKHSTMHHSGLKLKKDHSTTPEKRHVCPTCARTFVLEYNLRNHMEAHSTPVKPHKCPECGSGFMREGLLRRHVTAHSAVRPHVCPVCLHTFRYLHNMRKHLQSHTQHQCAHCGDTFQRMQHLKRHALSHTDERPFGCAECAMTFRRSDQRNYHVKHVHGLNVCGQARKIRTAKKKDSATSNVDMPVVANTQNLGEQETEHSRPGTSRTVEFGPLDLSTNRQNVPPAICVNWEGREGAIELDNPPHDIL